MMGAGYGYLMGLFPVNVLHNIVHLVIGIWGILAYRSFGASRLFSRALAIIYLLLAVMGLIPTLNMNTTFGLVPIFGLDVGLHLVTALIAAFFGWRSLLATSESRRVAGQPRFYESPDR